MVTIQPGVREKIESPTIGSEVTLIVEVSDIRAGIRRIERSGGKIEEELPYNSLVVKINEEDLREICDLGIVEHIEFEAEWEQANEGNFQFHPGSIT